MEAVQLPADADAGDRALNEVVGQNHQNLRFSNFLITVSTNTAPVSNRERAILAEWLRLTAEAIFDDWDVVNGTVLKPAGSDNGIAHDLGLNHQVVSVRSRVSLERGEDRGFYHMHVLLEVGHTYTQQNGYGNHIGVHVNVATLRAFLNSRIMRMHTAGLAVARLPAKIYVNSRLLTKQTDNSSKWLTLQYLNKTAPIDRTDIHGLDIVNQRTAGSLVDRNIRVGMLNPVEESNLDEDDTGYISPPASPSPAASPGGSPPDSPPVFNPPPARRRADPRRARYVMPPQQPAVNVVTSTANVQGLPRMTRARAKK